MVKRKLYRPRWTKSEVKILKSMYRTHSNWEIAVQLGRKESSVVFKGHRLGLRKSAARLKEMGKENIARRWETTRGRTKRRNYLDGVIMAQTEIGALKRHANTAGITVEEFMQRLQDGQKWCLSRRCWQ